MKNHRNVTERLRDIDEGITFIRKGDTRGLNGRTLRHWGPDKVERLTRKAERIVEAYEVTGRHSDIS